MKEIFVDSRDGVNHICIMEDDILVEYYLEEDKKNLVGNIYRARIDSVLKGMEAAFVDIGQGKNAYLHISDIFYQSEGKDTKPPISSLVKPGQEIMVQVVKEGLGDKGPKLSSYLSLSGSYMVLTPQKPGINVSRKIEDRNEIKRLRAIGKSLDMNMGMIFRTASESIDEEEIRAEYEELAAILSKIERQKNFLPTPKLIYKDLGRLYKAIRDSQDENLRILVNKEEVYREILDMEAYLNQPIKDRLKLDEDFKIDYVPRLRKAYLEALDRKVKLESGGYIVIDETEALIAIDVNTGKYVGRSSLEETVLQTNLEASKEIARQLKLRNLAGIIIIDFIDMKNQEDIDKVLESLDKYFKNDKNKPNIIGISRLGLVEITRKRTSPSLRSQVSKKCPHCQGLGIIEKHVTGT